MQAVISLKEKGYKTQPLRRIYISKKSGKLRPLSIPVMKCRAQQALHLLALEPIAETLADNNSYGFRPLRSTADAIEQCFKIFAKGKSAQWVLEGDIKACFDNINHSWLIRNIPLNKTMLNKWLLAGYIEKNTFHNTSKGTPQGGVISPVLMNMTLDGLEEAIKKASNIKDKVNFVRYADDFIISGATKQILEKKVKPAIVNFLKERGLSLAEKKTKISNIKDGLDFLGFNIRKYNSKFIIKPAKNSIKSFLREIRHTIQANYSTKTDVLIQKLNAKIRGWSNYYRNVCSKATFYYLDYHIFKKLWRWAIRRHPNKGARWIRAKYFRSYQQRNWIFFAPVNDKNGGSMCLDLFYAGCVPIKRHIKIRAAATPYDPEYREYFKKRTGYPG